MPWNGDGKKSVIGKDEEKKKRRAAAIIVAVLFLAVPLVFPATTLPILLPSYAATPDSKENLSNELFVKYEQLAWHYSYQESETQNLESFKEWWCQDPADDSCALAKNPDFIFMMRYFEQNRDAVIWNLTQQAPQVNVLPRHIKYLVSRDYADATNVEGTFAAPWKSFVTWNQLAFHFDFAKNETQNLQAFEKWWCEGPATGSSGNVACNSNAAASGQLVPMMWFNEQHRDNILAAKVIKQLDALANKSKIAGWISMDYQCAIEKNANACDMMTAADDKVQ
ncbi:hypothetical protein NTE_00590 [Candidatus Nitrososphaera evergladensis SR1]|uniref:Uncharacterized protein n=1 Tax=Candidatus Nitrososphaera evergladensis SR1 TaxID=1459636 RepID=A0A075MMH5_9ARCH|nr:hypothetical protein [Candidatus Nitrososphaera evergladensis]AIF82671.1 hypothetical protein NTE_00590 [Candidatus Nitrososphaera evergladensis SR1]